MRILIAIGIFLFALQSYAQPSDFKTIDFRKADANALECKGDGLENLPLLVYNLTANLTTDVERFRAIYRWVCGNIANDYGLYLRHMHKRQRFKEDSLKLKDWNNHFRKLSFKKLLKNQRTICTGYAYILKELASMANIECEIVDGFARTSVIDVKTLDTPNHTWNVVKLDGNWYLCDPTWASGTPNPTTSLFEFNYNDGFFLTNPELFAVNHYPVESRWFLMKDIPTFDSFLEAPIFYNQAYVYLKAHHSPQWMHNIIKKYQKVKFESGLQKDVKIEDVSLLVDNGISAKKVYPEAISISNQNLNFDYAFEKSGFYDVHLYIAADLISTYTFEVLK